jgi:hypothetical protein
LATKFPEWFYCKLCTRPNDAVTAGKIFGTPPMEQISVSSSHFFFFSDVFSILKSSSLLGQILFLETASSHVSSPATVFDKKLFVT